METIELKVDSEAAKLWNNSSDEEKAEYTAQLNVALKEILTKNSDLTEEELAIIAEDSKGEPYEWWNDKEMVAELEQMSADMESGKIKGIPWEEVKECFLNRPKQI